MQSFDKVMNDLAELCQERGILVDRLSLFNGDVVVLSMPLMAMPFQPNTLSAIGEATGSSGSGRRQVDCTTAAAAPAGTRQQGQAGGRGRRDERPGRILDAIVSILWRAGQRKTAGQLVNDIEERWPEDPEWKEQSIKNACTDGAKADGPLVNHMIDPNDGLGQGYGLREWDQCEE